MTESKHCNYLAIFIVVALGFLLPCKGFSQGNEGLDIATAYDTGVKAMDSGKYEIGLSAVNSAIQEHGSGAMQAYGPVFGHFYYLKGMLLIKQKKYQAAIEPLQICHDKFKNDVLKKQDPDQEQNLLPNRFRPEAMLQWAGCLMALKQFAEAAKKYELALAMEDSYEPKFNRLEAMVNLAKCYINSDQIQKGKDFLVEKILEEPRAPDSMKRSVFMILANDWSPKVKTEELRPLIHKYRNLMYNESTVDRYRKRNASFHGLAGLAIEKDDYIRSLMWYSMMVHPGDVSKYYTSRVAYFNGRIADAEKRKAAGQKGMDEYIKQFNDQVGMLAPEIPKQKTQLANMLMGIGACHYTMASLAGARSAYLELADHFPQHKERATILHNLVVCSVNLSLWREAYKYGLMFFDEFPDHDLKPGVARVLVEVIFIQGEYQEAYDVSSDVRTTMDLGSAIRDIPDFVAAASLYHLGRFEEAEVELESYIENYPQGQRLEPVAFYIGGTKVNLFKWDEAAEKLDYFLDTYPASEMRPSALYLSGLSHLVLENYAIAYSKIVELQAKFPMADEIPGSWNVKGDILSGEGERSYEEIIACYQESKRLYEEDSRGDIETVGYAHRQLISEAVDAQEWEVATTHYDHFKKNYTASSWRQDVSIAAVKPLTEVGRKDEAKALLEGFVNEFAGKPGSVELDEMFGAYAGFLGDNYTIEEVRAALKNFPSTIQPPPPALRAWIMMGDIEAMEGSDPKQYAEDIKQSFYRLSALYDSNGKDLSNYTLVRLARWNLKERGKEAEARKVYDFILQDRPFGEALGFALIDTAQLDAAKDDAVSQSSALDKFQRVLNEVDKPAMQEDAVLGVARIYSKQKKFDEATEWWDRYRDNSDWRKARPEASFNFGRCLENAGKTNEAAAAYVNTYSNYPGHLDWSTQAYLRTADIIKSNGKDLDALKILQDMLKRMGHLDHPNIEVARKTFQTWRAAYSPAN